MNMFSGSIKEQSPSPSLSPSGLPAAPCHPSPVREGGDTLANEESISCNVISPSLTGEGWQSSEGSFDGERLGERLGKESFGLVLEGGGMRGMFTCGVIDVMMERGIMFDGLVGVSAGAAFGCNYKSHQIGRALRYNQRFAADPRYMGLRSLLTTGNIINARFAYHVVPTSHDIFDGETFRRNPMAFHLVCTDTQTGLPVYKQLNEVNYETLEWIRATASMPGVSRPVLLDGKTLLDGGISDSIPLRYFQEQGYTRNVVVLTQPEGYQKKASRLQDMLLALFARKYPAVRRAMKERPAHYNAQVQYAEAEAAAGRAFIIRPDADLKISRLESRPDRLQAAYDKGRRKAEELLPALHTFLGRRG